jgi:hypothetical protein
MFFIHGCMMSQSFSLGSASNFFFNPEMKNTSIWYFDVPSVSKTLF